MRIHLIIIALLSLALSACGESAVERSPEEMAQITAQAASLRPDDPRLTEVYERSCLNCHSTPASGAPLTGDAAGWAPRLRKGNEVLLDNTINGFAGMPPMGLCPDCTATEFSSLIEFMSTSHD